MIESLRIEQLAIVEEAELDFGAGLNVLTGETGAGKSIVLGALALLVGGRASADSVRAGSEQGAVEALFRTDCHPELEAELAERGIEPEEHSLVVRRSLAREGRSRTRLGGQLVPVATLGELFAGRIEISSQHSSQALLSLDAHGRLLDAAGGLEKERSAVEAGVQRLRGLDQQREKLRGAAEERARRSDFLAFQVTEIDEVAPEPGERERLEEEHSRFQHAERIQRDGQDAVAALDGDPSDPTSMGAVDRVGRAARVLESVAALDPGLAPFAGRLREVEAELSDVSSELGRSLSRVESDSSAQERAADRLDALRRLARKYGDRVEEVLAFRDRTAAELLDLEHSDARLEELGAEREAAAGELGKAAKALTRGRKRAGQKLAREVEAGLASLAMEKARFEVELEPVSPEPGFPCASTGAERPEFLFAANAGEPLRALRKVASGGELSRLFLSIKNALRKAGTGVVLVFDEVDAGIGGSTAEQVGRTLAALAEHHQVLCITHLPQIAAFADVHFHVEKSESGKRTRTRIRRIEKAERVDELARMAGGAQVTAATRRHARELLKASRGG